MLLEPRNELEVTEVTTTAALRDLRSAWADLWLRCNQATPFQSPDWSIAWWEQLGSGRLWVQTFHLPGPTGRRLVGVAPLFIHAGEAGRRQVLLLGTGITDYLDILVEPGFAQPCVERLFAHLAENAHLWDECDFQQLRSGACLLESEVSSDWTGNVAVQEVCPVLPLPASNRVLSAAVPKRMAAKFAYYERQLSKSFAVSIETANEGNFEELFAAFLELHHRRWKAPGGDGVLAQASLQAFHYDVACRLLQRGALRLYGLRVGTRIIAVLYTFLFSGKACYYLSGFDPQYQSFCPGTILIGHAIRQALLDGATEFDFLRGRETYKYLWGAKGRLNCRRRLTLLSPAILRGIDVQLQREDRLA